MLKFCIVINRSLKNMQQHDWLYLKLSIEITNVPINSVWTFFTNWKDCKTLMLLVEITHRAGSLKCMYRIPSSQCLVIAFSCLNITRIGRTERTWQNKHMMSLALTINAVYLVFIIVSFLLFLCLASVSFL
jgi:hypothetical protein